MMDGRGGATWVVAAAALLCLAGPAPAQQQPRTVVPLRLGREVMVQVAGVRYAGRLAALGGDTLVVAPRGPAAGTLIAPADQVEALWVRGSGWKTGALIGGSVTGAAGGLLFSVGCLVGRSDDGRAGNEGQWADCALLGGAMGFAAGGLVGGAIGAMVSKWSVRYRARGGSALVVQLEF